MLVARGLGDLALKEDSPLRDPRILFGIDFRQGLFLFLGQGPGGGSFFQATHRQFVG